MSIYESAVFTVSSSKLDNLPPASVPEIAFAGRSNAGKSTAINTLTRQGKLAFASKTPGRTQLINFFELATKDKVTHERHPVAYLVDLPGYGYAKTTANIRSSWSDLVGGYISERSALLGVVLIMDARRPFMPSDEWVIEFMRNLWQSGLRAVLPRAEAGRCGRAPGNPRRVARPLILPANPNRRVHRGTARPRTLLF